MRIVSARLSPLVTELVDAVTWTTSPPQRFMAASNEVDVRVEGS